MSTQAIDKKPIEIKDKVCDYYLSQRGCVKGDECDHMHPVAPNGAITNKVCDFYGSPKGCSKGAECGFLHIKRYNPLGEECNRICDFYLTPSGCIKGMQCNFIHPRSYPANKARNNNFTKGNSNSNSNSVQQEQTVGSVTIKGSAVLINGQRVCEFYLTPTGCDKGTECRYSHPKGKEAQDALRAKEIVNKNKAGTKGGKPIRDNTKRGPKKGGNNSSKDDTDRAKKPCSFFKTEAGCKKGDECDYLHE